MAMEEMEIGSFGIGIAFGVEVEGVGMSSCVIFPIGVWNLNKAEINSEESLKVFDQTLSHTLLRPNRQGATARFTNGRTFVDILAQLLGFPNYIPPYARACGRDLLQEANYASGAAGIRDETGNNLGDHMSMNQQVDSFGQTVQQLRRYFRGDVNAVGTYLSKCIFYSGLGSNDYLNNYFMPDYNSTSSQYTPQAYAASLIQDYSRQLTELYKLGARKVIVTGVGQIGCIPYQLARYNGSSGNNRCNEEINSAIVLFNTALKRLVDRFNRGKLPGAKFVYLDSFQSSQDLVRNAKTYGFEVVDKGCCGVGRNNG
ncbi:GDSL esterase/lipase [Sesamum alatum]|uniref:GDSL esterase/lipase n=1 Tax=Sesamum alatum TaxID=300844 RepID=A0AAE1Y7Y7_9LAMI|nr:GDSL esterase/lipase [Sesamum alatum]